MLRSVSHCRRITTPLDVSQKQNGRHLVIAWKTIDILTIYYNIATTPHLCLKCVVRLYRNSAQQEIA